MIAVQQVLARLALALSSAVVLPFPSSVIAPRRPVSTSPPPCFHKCHPAFLRSIRLRDGLPSDDDDDRRSTVTTMAMTRLAVASAEPVQMTNETLVLRLRGWAHLPGYWGRNRMAR